MAYTMMELKERLERIQDKIRAAADETTLAMLSLELAGEYPEWREGVSARTLDYVVSLDTALAGLHRERQKLLENQMEATVA